MEGPGPCIWMCLLALTTLLILQTPAVNSGDPEDDPPKEKNNQQWSYNDEQGPTYWHKLFPDLCGKDKKRQSPVDIVPANVKYEEELRDIDIVEKKEDSEDGERMFMFNNGKTVNIGLVGDVYVSGGALGDVYKVAGVHFHWGSDNAMGSEHRIDGHMMPLEAHIVTYDSARYSTLVEAVNGYNSLAVFGILFQVGGENNTALAPLVNRLEQVRHPDKEQRVILPWIRIQDLLPAHSNRYFRYEGSLTTPPCAESVIWTLFEEMQTLSQYQLDQFRLLHQGVGPDGSMYLLKDNWRPPQPLGERVVYASFVPNTKLDIVLGADTTGNTAAVGRENRALFSASLIVAWVFSLHC